MAAIGLLLFLSLFSCINHNKPSMKISVELDIYSGRPNPGWVLENREAEELSRLLQNLPARKTPAPAIGLGYRGFIVTIHNGGKEEVLHVYADKIIAGTDSVKIMEDKNGVERKLLQMAREKGLGDTLDMLGVK
jgi:hypothetical protein